MTRLFLVWLLLATLTQAQSTNNTTVLPDSQYEPWNDSPNATAILPIAAFDLGTRYPGRPRPAASSEAGNSWRLQLNFTERQHSPYFDGPTTLVTTHLIPPRGALFDDETGAWDIDEDVASTWRLTAIRLEEDALEVGAGNNKDGSCEGIVSSDCMRDMKDNIIQNPATRKGDGRMSQGLDSIESCPFRTASFATISLNKNFTKTAYSLWEDTTESTRYKSAYDHYGSRPRAVVYVWGHSNTTAVGQPLNDNHIIFTCIRVDQALGSSRLPSAGVRLGGGWSKWRVVVVSVAVAATIG